jgi:hypothetical protein
MSQAIKDFKGYAVGGDDTEWRKFLSARFNEIMNDTSTESNESTDDNEDFINAMSSFVDVTQNTISHSPKSSSVGQIKTDIIRGLV